MNVGCRARGQTFLDLRQGSFNRVGICKSDGKPKVHSECSPHKLSVSTVSLNGLIPILCVGRERDRTGAPALLKHWSNLPAGKIKHA